MQWIALITLFMEIFGPLIKQLIEKWLNRAAKKIKGPESFSSPAVATTALYDAAIAEAKWIIRAPIRALLRVAKRAALSRSDVVFAKASGAKVKIPPLTKAEREELKDACHLARE